MMSGEIQVIPLNSLNIRNEIRRSSFNFSYSHSFTEKNKTALENENAEIASDLQRISQLKQDSERKTRNLEQQLNEGNAVRAAQDEKISKLEGSTNKLQKECDQLTNQIEEIETKAAGLEVV